MHLPLSQWKSRGEQVGSTESREKKATETQSGILPEAASPRLETLGQHPFPHVSPVLPHRLPSLPPADGEAK